MHRFFRACEKQKNFIKRGKVGLEAIHSERDLFISSCLASAEAEGSTLFNSNSPG